jgi:hypothetical protein
VGIPLLIVFVVLFAFAVVGEFNLWPSRLPDPLVCGTVREGRVHDTLFVLVHGWRGSPQTSWTGAQHDVSVRGTSVTRSDNVIALDCGDSIRESRAQGVAIALEGVRWPKRSIIRI